MGDLIEAAVGRLPFTLAKRALDDVAVFLRRRAAMVAAAERGCRVAPYWLQPLPDLLAVEAARRARMDDRTWIVWDAYAARERSLTASRYTR